MDQSVLQLTVQHNSHSIQVTVGFHHVTIQSFIQVTVGCHHVAIQRFIQVTLGKHLAAIPSAISVTVGYHSGSIKTANQLTGGILSVAIQSAMQGLQVTMGFHSGAGHSSTARIRILPGSRVVSLSLRYSRCPEDFYLIASICFFWNGISESSVGNVSM